MKKRIQVQIALAALVCFALANAGCNHMLFENQRELEEDLRGLDKPAEYLPPPDADPGYLKDGSLWQESNASASLFTDSKARQVNDLVTILVSETSRASKKATTDLSRDANVEADATAFFGLSKELAERNPSFDPTAIMSAQISSATKGSGSTTRDETLIATMTAVVQDVMPNGNLVIKGRRVVGVNEESQYMVLTGMIRPQDISPSNTIPSSLIADARITYSGIGVVSDKQSPGWLTRAVDWFWPL